MERFASAGRGTSAADPPRPPPGPDDFGRHPWLDGSAGGRGPGEVLAAIGSVVAALRLRPGHRCLEIGAGPGNFALSLALMGCDVTFFDLEGGHGEQVGRRSERLGVAVDVHGGTWRDAPRIVEGRRFDVVLLDGALCRCEDPVTLLRLVREHLLAAGGRLVLVGEPEADDLGTAWDFDPGRVEAGPPSGERRLSLVFQTGFLEQALNASDFLARRSAVPFVPGLIVASRKR